MACGAIASYNDRDNAYGVRNTFLAISKRLTFRGILVVDEYMTKHTRDRDEKIIKWIQEGSFQSKEHITQGMDRAVEGFLGMLKGENLGKAVLKISDEE